MRQCQPISPKGCRVWLISDVRNDAVLEAAIARLPRGSGVVFRHYHLPLAERKQRFNAVRRLCRARGHALILAGTPALARAWRADGSYGTPCLGRTIATAHDLAEIGKANRLGAAAVMLSPVYPTRSHPGAATLGPLRFRLLAARVVAPVIALGGMTRRTARRLGASRWAAIDGLTPQEPRKKSRDIRRFQDDS
nr:thiamine phosphate synthase [Novosphingobium sp.]